MDERDVAAQLGEMGYGVDVEAYAARSSETLLAAYAGLSALAALLVYALPLVAAAVGIAAVVLHARAAEGRPLVGRVSSTASNVVARSPASGRPLLVVVAPLVACSSRFGERTTRALLVSLQTLMIAIAAAGATAWIAEVEAELPRWVAAAGGVGAVAIAVVATALHRAAPAQPVENGALETLLALSPSLRDRRVWLLVAGTAGVEAFLDAHAQEVAGAAWLNLEPGKSETVAVSEEGTWRERRADRGLMGAAEEAGAAVRPYRAAPTNATPLLARRRRALTLIVPPGGDAIRIARATAAAAFDLTPAGTLGTDADE
ncbi:MAG TPA: hypothetical protein VHI71_03655 [Actinomycetota bacterium]|nr:hypothetical protein [Actinomycetota bacterium]